MTDRDVRRGEEENERRRRNTNNKTFNAHYNGGVIPDAPCRNINKRAVIN